MPIGTHTNFRGMMGPIPGQGWTQPLGAAKWQQPPQFTMLNDLLEHIWYKLNQPEMGIKVYGLLKGGLPAEAIARTLLFGAFCHGLCTVSLAQMAIRTVVRQIVALGTFLGLKHIKIKNPKPEQVAQLAAIAKKIGDNGDNDAGDQVSSATGTSDNGIFSGLGQ